jgi:hypothetical protein
MAYNEDSVTSLYVDVRTSQEAQTSTVCYADSLPLLSLLFFSFFIIALNPFLHLDNCELVSETSVMHRKGRVASSETEYAQIISECWSSRLHAFRYNGRCEGKR